MSTFDYKSETCNISSNILVSVVLKYGNSCRQAHAIHHVDLQAAKVKFFSATPTTDTTVGIGTSLFVIRKTDNLIGLSTVKVGIGSTGVRFGLGLTGTLPTFEEICYSIPPNAN